MANTDGKEITFDGFMRKMLSSFARSEGYLRRGYIYERAEFLKFLHNNLGKLKDYIRKYDIVILEKSGNFVFFSTRLLNEDKKDELIKQCKEDLKKFGVVITNKTATNNSSDNNKSGDMFPVTFDTLNSLDFFSPVNRGILYVNIDSQGLGAYISKNSVLNKLTNKKQEDLGKKSENTFNIICTNNHDGPVPSPYGTERRGRRQGELIKKILEPLFAKSVSLGNHVDVTFSGQSYGNAMKNYLYPELHKLFKDNEDKKDERGIKYVNVNYNIESPYLPIETPYTLGRDSLYGHLTKEKLPKNVVLNVIPSSRCLDPFHPQWFAEEVKETLMNNSNTKDNMCDYTKIEFFCREIPKTYDKENPFFKKQNKHICWFSNSLKETDNNNVASLDKEKLRNALYEELNVLRYLMEKHKNSRARVFYKSIFVPTLDKFIKKCGIEGKNIADNKTDKSDKATQELKNYLDSINKEQELINLTELKKPLIKLKDGEEDTLHSIKKGAEILKYAIDNHRHKRGIKFTYVYEKIINDTINNVHKNAGIQK